MDQHPLIIKGYKSIAELSLWKARRLLLLPGRTALAKVTLPMHWLFWCRSENRCDTSNP